jgi:hypothetical protein
VDYDLNAFGRFRTRRERLFTLQKRMQMPDRKGLTYRVSPAEQGKPVLLLSRKGHRKVIRVEVRATEEGESQGRSVAERILAASEKSTPSAGLRKQADFLLVFPTRKLD